eukprot:gnl/TRDRNA2_/TRDRNA2_170665_c0_seq1.p1 gnl/TRDRNA2_/TRDRNA2_170665_c0~~gnl/TRDRNA2_/TRDRNA2_170665_c0_seq1.p1  ORF type:complete len:200 (-),score=1.90 gnl/TRDRNA2_/TRDRNA2_170665_c0_seq1:97-696(-)
MHTFETEKFIYHIKKMIFDSLADGCDIIEDLLRTKYGQEEKLLSFLCSGIENIFHVVQTRISAKMDNFETLLRDFFIKLHIQKEIYGSNNIHNEFEVLKKKDLIEKEIRFLNHQILNYRILCQKLQNQIQCIDYDLNYSKPNVEKIAANIDAIGKTISVDISAVIEGFSKLQNLFVYMDNIYEKSHFPTMSKFKHIYTI